MERLLASLDAAVEKSEEARLTFASATLTDPVEIVCQQVHNDFVRNSVAISDGDSEGNADVEQYRSVEEVDEQFIVRFSSFVKGQLPFSDAELEKAKKLGDAKLGTVSTNKAALPANDDLKRAIYQFGDFLCRRSLHGAPRSYSLETKPYLSKRGKRSVTQLIMFQPEPIASSFMAAKRAYGRHLTRCTKKMGEEAALKHKMLILQKAMMVTVKRLQKIRNPPKRKTHDATEGDSGGTAQSDTAGSDAVSQSLSGSTTASTGSDSSVLETDNTYAGSDDTAPCLSQRYRFKKVYGVWEVARSKLDLPDASSTHTSLSFASGSTKDSYGALSAANAYGGQGELDAGSNGSNSVTFSASATFPTGRSYDSSHGSLSFNSGSVSDSYGAISESNEVHDDEYNVLASKTVESDAESNGDDLDGSDAEHHSEDADMTGYSTAKSELPTIAISPQHNAKAGEDEPSSCTSKSGASMNDDDDQWLGMSVNSQSGNNEDADFHLGEDGEEFNLGEDGEEMNDEEERQSEEDFDL